MSDASGDTPQADRVTDDRRLEFIYQEALRGIIQQQTFLESLHNRAGTLIFAASFASSLLGSRALADGLNTWDWIAVALLLGIGILAVVLLWPYYNLTFRFDAQTLIDQYVDHVPPVSTGEMYRRLALQLREYGHENSRIVRRMRFAFEAALVLLILEILAWLFSIAGGSL